VKTAKSSASAILLLPILALSAGCAAPAVTEPAPAPAVAATPAPEPAAAYPAGSEDESRAAAAFERLASLAGEWKGDFQMGESKGQASVTYRLTGGGSTLEETLFKGSPHEMVTMYHRDGPRLLLTHYCAAGNQPTMVLVASDDPAVLRFDFLRATNLKTPGAGHMHSAVLDFSKPGRLRSTWTYWADGKAGDTAVFEVERAL
jgi:hypothetical protein